MIAKGNAALAGDAAIETAALRSDRFRVEREGDWQRLEQIVSRMESGRLGKIADADVLALPTLYRTVASSLSIARETSLDRATLAYLEGLTSRAWFLVYGPRTSLAVWFRQFLGGGWGAAVRSIMPDIWISFLIMLAGTIVGWALVSQDAQWYSVLVGDIADVRVPGASKAVLQSTLFDGAGQSGLSVFAAGLFSHNSQISIMCFALGFIFGIPTVLLLVHNTAMLGAMLWLFHDAGLGVEFGGWLAVHGTTELFAILLAGAAGIHIGRSMAFPGGLSVADSASSAGRRTALVMVGVVLMLVVAALLEGFARQLINVTSSRYILGGFMLLFWIFYLFFWRRDRFGDEGQQSATHGGR